MVYLSTESEPSK